MTAFFPRLPRFFRGKRMRLAQTMSRLAAEAMNLPRFLRIHGRKSAFTVAVSFHRNLPLWMSNLCLFWRRKEETINDHRTHLQQQPTHIKYREAFFHFDSSAFLDQKC
jgi:hypothetical protein